MDSKGGGVVAASDNAVILLVAGPPGAGKTTICRDLVDASRSRSAGAPAADPVQPAQHLVWIEYDHVQASLCNGDWKRTRRTVEHLVDRLLLQQQQYRCSSPSLSMSVPDPEPLDSYFSSRILSQLPAASAGDGRALIILLDDNFYYRSMRDEWSDRCRRVYCCRWGQVWLRADLEACLVRNQQRAEGAARVPVHVIQRMFQVMEEPAESETTLVLLSTQVAAAAASASIWDFLSRLLLRRPAFDPQQWAASEQQRTADRDISAKNFIHQLDLGCRRIIAERMQQHSAGGAAASRQAIAERLHFLKAEFLDQERQLQLQLQHLLEERLAAFSLRADRIVD